MGPQTKYFHNRARAGILTFLLLVILVARVFPSSPSLFFSNITTQHRMSSNITNSIVQDSYGFIWIGTQEGLCRYDGFRMTVFKNDNTPTSISSNNISSLLYDDNYIWVGTWDGLNRIDIRTHEVTRIHTGEARVIRTLYKDREGKIWVGTSRGLLIHNKETGEFSHYNTTNSNLSHNTIRSFYQSQTGEMWIGTFDGLNRFSHGKFIAFNLKGNYKPQLENNLILSIQPQIPGDDSLLWVGTETGLALFNTFTGGFTLYNTQNTELSNEVIKSIYHVGDSVLWLGTDFGLNTFNYSTGDVFTYYHDPLINHTIASNVIWEIFEDRQQRIWLITSNGVSVTEKKHPFYTFNEQYFSSVPVRIGNQVRDILYSSAGEIWLATIHGVVRKDPETGKEKTFSTTSAPHNRILLNNVYALKEDEQGRIWIGTAGGINLWDQAAGRMLSITANRENGLLSNYISGFATDCNGNMWVTAWEGGLFRIDWEGTNTRDMSFRLIDSGGDGLLVAVPGFIYYGNNAGFWSIDPKGFTKKRVQTVTNALGNNQISAMAIGSDSSVWLGTSRKILRYFPLTDSLITFEVHTGRPQKIINLQEDRHGTIWATTPNAIIRLNTETLEQILIPIDKNSPMKGFYPYCADITPAGKILFGGDNGYIIFDPGRIELNNDVPQVFISGLFVNNQQVHPGSPLNIINSDIAFVEQLRLKHNQNSLTFEFSTLDYFFPDFVQFQYRLVPGNEQWIITPGEKNFAVFANLRPGNYILEVKGSDRFGRWSQVNTLPVTILSSLWLSQTFILIYIVLFFSGSWYAYRVYRNRRRLRNELQLIKLEKQHAEALYHAKIRFFTNISHEFRTPLSLIIPPLHQLLKGNDDLNTRERLLKMANRNAQRLYKLVDQLLDFRKIEAEDLDLAPMPIEMVSFCRNIFESFDDLAARNKIDYSITSNLDSFIMEVDAEKLETIVFNLLSNAFKYTPYGGTIVLSVTLADEKNSHNRIVVSVKDSGIGISAEDQEHIFEQFYQTAESKSLKKGSGIGLTLAREYTHLHGGTITVESEPGKGSEFKVSLPVTVSDNVRALKPVKREACTPADRVLKSAGLPPSSRRILVIDDNEDVLEYIEMNLSSLYNITLARNGEEGLSLLESLQADLVISDVMMPVMDGIELCARIRQNKGTSHIPVILLTARSLDIHKTEGINTGAVLYITKPFDIEYLKSCISGIFRREKQMTAYIKKQLLLTPSPESDTVKNQDELFLKRVMALIEHNFSNPELSVDLLGKSLGMSATHLYRKLKEITGFSTKEIIINYRMQKAAQMIENNEGNISEIMYEIGFSSLSGFSRGFKAKFGVAPSAYGARKDNEIAG